MVERKVVESSYGRCTRYDIGNRRRCTVEVTWGAAPICILVSTFTPSPVPKPKASPLALTLRRDKRPSDRVFDLRRWQSCWTGGACCRTKVSRLLRVHHSRDNRGDIKITSFSLPLSCQVEAPDLASDMFRRQFRNVLSYHPQNGSHTSHEEITSMRHPQALEDNPQKRCRWYWPANRVATSRD